MRLRRYGRGNCPPSCTMQLTEKWQFTGEFSYTYNLRDCFAAVPLMLTYSRTLIPTTPKITSLATASMRMLASVLDGSRRIRFTVAWLKLLK